LMDLVYLVLLGQFSLMAYQMSKARLDGTGQGMFPGSHLLLQIQAHLQVQHLLGGQDRYPEMVLLTNQMDLELIGHVHLLATKFQDLNQAAPLMALDFLVDQTNYLEMECLVNLMNQWRIGRVPCLAMMSQAFQARNQRMVPLRDLEFQAGLRNFPDQENIQMLLVGIGHVDNHKNLCQVQESHPKRNLLSLVDPTVCRVMVQMSNQMVLLLTGPEPSLQMM